MNTSLISFFNQQKAIGEPWGNPSNDRMVAAVLNVSFESATVATCTAMEEMAGTIVRNGFLIMMAQKNEAILLRVNRPVDSPIAQNEAQTAFEMAKRAITTVDDFTDYEMSFRCYACDILGSFVEENERICFSGEVAHLDPSKNYQVFTLTPELLELIVNGIYGVSGGDVFRATEYSPRLPKYSSALFSSIGHYRSAESDFNYLRNPPAKVFLPDLCGKRAGIFGKTRSGKSNTVKMIVKANLEAFSGMGQLIIDTNGEYANDNPQDGKCMLNRFPAACEAYAITPKNSAAHILRFNFYDSPDAAMSVIRTRLQDRATANYAQAFLNANVPSLDDIAGLAPGGERVRAIRKVLYFWTVLHNAGFAADETRLSACLPAISSGSSAFDPGFSARILDAVYAGNPRKAPASLDELRDQLSLVWEYARLNTVKDSSNKDLFDPEDRALLGFAFPPLTASGPSILGIVRSLHDPRAAHFLPEICDYLDKGKTVILDTSNAAPDVATFLVDKVCATVFHHQEQKFVSDKLRDRYVQIYIEEAHNYFPVGDKDTTNIYARIAKEGAKYHLGLTYATQSPSTISGELLNQTENFFVAHMDSRLECEALEKRCAPFKGVADSLLRIHTPGYLYMLTASARYPIPVQIRNFGGGI